MKIATFNVNGIKARLPALLRWLAEFEPDVACLQELKAPAASTVKFARAKKPAITRQFGSSSPA